jgi:ABC-type transporter Mla subunit MlaD
MEKRTKIAIGMAAGVVVVAAGGAGAAVAAGGGDDGEEPITGDALDKASAAALEHTGGGRVTETEVGDEESLYEVEVTLDDGSQVDVQLDEDFDVVGDERDDAGEDEGPGDD